MAPVAEVPNTSVRAVALLPEATTAPKTAARDTRLSSTALIGSRSERKVRTSSTNVISAISAST